MEIYKEFAFDSAHFLPNVAEGHKCKNIHGHTYRVRIYVKGSPDEHLGWIVDFNELKELVIPVISKLDHTLLNNISGLENPTAENITRWLWQKLKPGLPAICRIELKETQTTGVIYSGE